MTMSAAPSTDRSPFWPLCLMALSLVIILGWQLTAGIQQYSASRRMAEQQALMAQQAAQTESKLQAMMTDLLLLAKTDPEAKTIVEKYRIKMNPDKPASGASGAPTPQAGSTASPK